MDYYLSNNLITDLTSKVFKGKIANAINDRRSCKSVQNYVSLEADWPNYERNRLAHRSRHQERNRLLFHYKRNLSFLFFSFSVLWKVANCEITTLSENKRINKKNLTIPLQGRPQAFHLWWSIREYLNAFIFLYF